MSTPRRTSEGSTPRSIPTSIRRPTDDIGFTGSPATSLARGDINYHGHGDNRYLFVSGSQPSSDGLGSPGYAHVHRLDGSNDDSSSAIMTPSDDSEFGTTEQADEKGKGEKSPPPIYFGPQNFDPASDVSEEAMDFIDTVAAAVAPVIVTTLSTIQTNITNRYPPVQATPGMGVDFFAAKIAEREEQVDEYMQYRLGGIPLKANGLTKKITANVPKARHTRMYDPRPPPPPLTAEQKLVERFMRPDMRIVLPGHFVKVGPVEAAFEPSPQFVGRLREAFEFHAKTGLAAEGQDALLLFEREKELKGQTLGLGEGEEVCIFKMLEEDFDWYREPEQFNVANLDWMCQTCKSRHAVLVTEMSVE